MRTELTPREVEILALVKLGYSNNKTGPQLGISPQTVKNRLQVIYAKLQATNRVDAVVKAVKAGYLQLD